MTARQDFETDRRLLRGLRRSDRSFIGDLIGDENVRRYLGGPVPFAGREAYISRYFSKDVDAGQMVWLAEAKATYDALGMVLLQNHKDSEDFELSYQFHPGTWGHGYATEVVRRVFDYALKEMGMKRLIAETQSANLASARLLERLGMRELRRLQRFGADQVIYASVPAQSEQLI